MSRDQFDVPEATGGLANFELTVQQAWFATSPEYAERAGGANPVFLHWAGTTNLPGENAVLTGEGFHPKWRLADDWVTVDGKTVVSQSGTQKTPATKSAFGRMARQVVAITEEFKDRPDDPLAGDIHQADLWVGTRWLMDQIEVPGSENWPNSEGKRQTALLPVAYLGKVEGVAQALPTAPPMAAPVAPVAPPVQVAAAPAPAPAVSAPAAQASNGVRDVLANLAAQSPDYRTFQQAALQIPGLATDTALVQEVLDAGPTGFYTRATGRS
jgi:hypothetical protein